MNSSLNSRGASRIHNNSYANRLITSLAPQAYGTVSLCCQTAISFLLFCGKPLPFPGTEPRHSIPNCWAKGKARSQRCIPWCHYHLSLPRNKCSDRRSHLPPCSWAVPTSENLTQIKDERVCCLAVQKPVFQDDARGAASQAQKAQTKATDIHRNQKTNTFRWV